MNDIICKQKSERDFLLLEWMRSYLPKDIITQVDQTMRASPDRITSAYEELLSGYGERIDDHLSVAATYDQGSYKGYVSALKIPFSSFCMHHLLPYSGTVDVVYRPNELILGLGKIARIIGTLSKRFQIQEHLAKEIAEGMDCLTKGCGTFVSISAVHCCVCNRGPLAHGSTNVVTYATGELAEVKSQAQLANVMIGK